MNDEHVKIDLYEFSLVANKWCPFSPIEALMIAVQIMKSQLFCFGTDNALGSIQCLSASPFTRINTEDVEEDLRFASLKIQASSYFFNLFSVLYEMIIKWL